MQRHVIHRQILDAEFTGGEAQGYGVQEELRGVCAEGMQRALERLFDRVVPADEHWMMERVEIDAGVVRREGMEEALVAAVVEAVERELTARRRGRAAVTVTAGPGGGGELFAGERAVATRSEAEYIRETIVHFLQTGMLPWWFVREAERTLEQLARESWGRGEQAAMTRALREALRDGVAVRRLVRQFSVEFRETLLTAMAPGVAEALRMALELAAITWPEGRKREAAERTAWERAFTAAAEGAETVSAARLLGTGEASRGGAAAGGTEEAAREDGRGRLAGKESLTEEEIGALSPCAGIVLLHPFLPRFFAAAGVADGDRLTDPERAVGLLHYLATGRKTAPEHDLAVAKALCNWPAEEPVEANVDISPEVAEEAEALLGAVIRHWEALGDTSADGLRGGFLVRSGKLTRRSDGDWLQMETQSYDILLDRLPWGIGLIQLPWMARTLWVDWRY